MKLQKYKKQDKGYCDLLFGLYPSSLCFANTMLQGMALPSSSGEPSVLGPVDQASLYRYDCKTYG
jgi:hypothetical protein